MIPLLKTICGGWLIVSGATPVHAQTACSYSDRMSELETYPAEPLTLERALRRAVLTAPELETVAIERRALSAETAQTTRWLNPTVSIDVENFAGAGELSSFGGAETTIAFGQTFRLGGKRRLATSAGLAREEQGRAECQVALRDIQLATGTLYYSLVAAIENAQLAQNAADTATALAEIVEKRVRAGAAAAPELARAQADAASQSALADIAQGDVEAAALALASIWAESRVDFVLPSSAETPKELPHSTARENAHPWIEAARAQERVLEAETAIARAKSIPDLTVTAGLRRFEDTGDDALVVGVSIPLPLFDRHIDATSAATLRQHGATLMASAVETRLDAQTQAIRAQYSSAQAALRRLRDEALPSAQQAYEAAKRGYRVGKFDLTTALDARRSLIEAQAARIDASRSTNTLALRLQALTGTGLFAGDQDDG